MASKILIIGCGYIGLPLALRLKKRGDEVTGWVHTTASAEALAEHRLHRVIAGNVGDEQIWKRLQEKYDVVIHCASSSRGGAEAYEVVYFQGVLKMNAHQAEARRIFVSSTSVYGQTQGEIVTEESPAESATETSRILREAEKLALAAGGIVVRSSGIYGPGRRGLFEKFRRGEAMIEKDGSWWMNQIHQGDLVAALEHLIDKGEPGHIYNATDDTPVKQRDYYAWCSEFLQKPMPPRGPINVNRKRRLTSKRVSNAKLRGTGWKPKFPSFREGLQGAY